MTAPHRNPEPYEFLRWPFCMCAGCIARRTITRDRHMRRWNSAKRASAPWTTLPRWMRFKAKNLWG